LIVSSIVLQVLRSIVRQEQEKQAEVQGVELEPEESFWSRFSKSTTDIVPIEKEETILLDHNYDGIQELDNHLPPWWKWLFYFTIGFGVVYLIVYHVLGLMPLQTAEYEEEIAAAEKQRQEYLASQPSAVIDESTVAMVDDAASLADGKQVYDNNCAACHRADGGGGIGPNLTDNYWLHGGSIESVFTTIKVGVPENGMISWEPLLSPSQMQNVASYIMTMVGTNPPDAKEPQGELYTPDSGEETTPADSTEAVALN
jgi:cytochrome c oxidase cbb3-type subunit 3